MEFSSSAIIHNTHIEKSSVALYSVRDDDDDDDINNIHMTNVQILSPFGTMKLNRVFMKRKGDSVFFQLYNDPASK